MTRRLSRPPGSRKPPGSGRKKGTPNKNPTNLRRFLDEHYPGIGTQIVDKLVEFAFADHHRHDLRLKALVELRDMKWGRPPQMPLLLDPSDAYTPVTQVILAPRE